jgi:hypothetical protein
MESEGSLPCSQNLHLDQMNSVHMRHIFIDAQGVSLNLFRLQNMFRLSLLWSVNWSSSSMTVFSVVVVVVACLQLDPRFAGSSPAEDDGFLGVIKIRSTTSFGGDVKSSVPCRRFTACKRTLRAWKDALQAKFSGHVSHPCLSCFATRWLWQTNQDWVKIVQRQQACNLHRCYKVWDTEKASLNKL